jgi:hypothetical protein
VVYTDIPDTVRWAALLSTRAQLAYLDVSSQQS